MFRTITIILLISICILTPTPPILAKDALRVISLAPAITEIIYALGADDMLVGVSTYCDYPLAAQSKEKVGGFINPNLEKIVSLAPNLVIMSPNSGTKQIQARLDHLNINNTVVEFYTIDGLRRAYEIIGDQLEKKEEARQLRQALDEKIRMIAEKVAERERPRVLFLRSHNPLYVAAGGSYEDDLIEIAGATNCVPQRSARYPQYSIEEIMRLNPEIIIDATFYDTPNQVQLKAIQTFWQRLKTVDAVKNNKLYIIKTDIHSVPGPRTTLLLDIISQLVHPEVFGTESEYSEQILLSE